MTFDMCHVPVSFRCFDKEVLLITIYFGRGRRYDVFIFVQVRFSDHMLSVL